MAKKLDQLSRARMIVALDHIKVTGVSGDKIRSAIVPGTEAKQYEVILSRQGPVILTECNLMLNGNNKTRCQGDKWICYHAIAAVIASAKENGFVVKYCKDYQSAQKIVRMGGKVYKVRAKNNRNKTHYLVVNKENAPKIVKKEKPKRSSEEVQASIDKSKKEMGF